MKNINETEAVLLHASKYKETSLLCDFFTLKKGRLSVIAKGARRKNNKFQNIMSPGTLAKISFSGRSDLKTLIEFEELKLFKVQGKDLKIFLYLHELIFKIIEKDSSQEVIFKNLINIYRILETGDSKEIEFSLRRFEYALLNELGYGFDFYRDHQGNKISKKVKYSFHPSEGFTEERSSKEFLKIPGTVIIDFAEGSINTKEARYLIKKVMQQALNFVIEKPINAGKIFE